MIITAVLILALIAIHIWLTNKNKSIEVGLFWGLFFGFAFSSNEDENAVVRNFQIALGFITVNISTYEYK